MKSCPLVFSSPLRDKAFPGHTSGWRVKVLAESVIAAKRGTEVKPASVGWRWGRHTLALHKSGVLLTRVRRVRTGQRACGSRKPATRAWAHPPPNTRLRQMVVLHILFKSSTGPQGTFPVTVDGDKEDEQAGWQGRHTGRDLKVAELNGSSLSLST